MNLKESKELLSTKIEKWTLYNLKKLSLTVPKNFFEIFSVIMRHNKNYPNLERFEFNFSK